METNYCRLFTKAQSVQILHDLSTDWLWWEGRSNYLFAWFVSYFILAYGSSMVRSISMNTRRRQRLHFSLHYLIFRMLVLFNHNQMSFRIKNVFSENLTILQKVKACTYTAAKGVWNTEIKTKYVIEISANCWLCLNILTIPYLTRQ